MKLKNTILLLGTVLLTHSAFALTHATYDCTNSSGQMAVVVVADDQNVEFFIQRNPPSQKNLLGSASLEVGQNPEALRKYFGNLKDENGNPSNVLSDLRITFSQDGSVTKVETVNNNILLDAYSNCIVDNGQ